MKSVQLDAKVVYITGYNKKQENRNSMLNSHVGRCDCEIFYDAYSDIYAIYMLIVLIVLIVIDSVSFSCPTEGGMDFKT